MIPKSKIEQLLGEIVEGIDKLEVSLLEVTSNEQLQIKKEFEQTLDADKNNFEEKLNKLENTLFNLKSD